MNTRSSSPTSTFSLCLFLCLLHTSSSAPLYEAIATLHYVFKFLLPLVFGAEGVTQSWDTTCLAFMKSWVQYPAPKQSNIKNCGILVIF